jgi:hypothetical protein
VAVDKHINFFELQKACEKPGCPLCRIVSDRAERYIDNMLFEHVSDRGFRWAYRSAGGFCNFHARNLESFRDGLAVAILSRDVMEDALAVFKGGKPLKITGQKPGGSGRCPVCEERDRIETEYLGFLAGTDGDSPEEQELREAFTASEGLCVPHYGQLLNLPRKSGGIGGRGTGGGGVPSWLREFHENRFAALLRRTGQFIEFSAYGRQEEFAKLTPEDQVVWKELAVTLRGGER